MSLPMSMRAEEEARRPAREQQARGRAGDREQQALGEQQPDRAAPRPDPSAARIAISRWRTVPRTSSRFATFMHAMSSTSVASPSMDPRMQRHQRREEAHRDRTRQRLGDHAGRDVLLLRIRALQPLRRPRRPPPARSSTLTPGRSRASTVRERNVRSVKSRSGLDDRPCSVPEWHEPFDLRSLVETVEARRRHADDPRRHAVEPHDRCRPPTDRRRTAAARTGRRA